jgi:hypothetical protein
MRTARPAIFPSWINFRITPAALLAFVCPTIPCSDRTVVSCIPTAGVGNMHERVVPGPPVSKQGGEPESNVTHLRHHASLEGIIQTKATNVRVCACKTQHSFSDGSGNEKRHNCTGQFLPMRSMRVISCVSGTRGAAACKTTLQVCSKR